jgi:DNA helicase-2/ATP-dependent DNA helicase PcrA
MIDFLNELNPPQAEAVTYTKGPLLVLAGAGSGKTRVLTYRIAYLIGKEGIDPYKILAVTFTNKAAGEMKQRIEKLLGNHSVGVWMSTFHSFCARLLRKEAPLLGYNQNFSIYDEDDQLSLIKKSLEELEIPSKQFSPPAILNAISSAKNKLIDSEEYRSRASDFFEERVAKVYTLYQKRLKAANAFDFDDLIMQAVNLFQNFPQVLQKYQNRFEYILVDEYQDTNHSQYVLVNLLANKSKNLCVVGDDDQSIYGWRGADIGNILNFEKDYPQAKVVKLEQNYRSTQIILDAAFEVIKNNLSRKGKKLWTAQPGGEKINLLFLEDDKMEGLALAQRVNYLLQNSNKSCSDFVVLYRTNAQSRLIEQALRDKGIPYAIVGGVRFYERKEVKDILAYLKILVNPQDIVSWKRVILLSLGGVGEKSFARIEEFNNSQQIDFKEGLKNISRVEGISARQKEKLKEFEKLITHLSEQRNNLPIDEFANTVVEKTGYLDELIAEKTIEAETRAENVKELLSAISEFKERAESPTLESFLEEVSLLTAVDRWDQGKEVVTLMTLHSAKGLEFPVVFITGLEEGLFPLSRCMENPDELEEERRLFYVGITRAKEKLFLSYSQKRRRFGEMQNMKSRFLEEIPEELLEVEDYTLTSRYPASQNHPRENQTLDSDFDFFTSNLKIGTKVIHPHFGAGKILSTEGSGENMKLVVRFNTGQTKKLLVKYANLEIIG